MSNTAGEVPTPVIIHPSSFVTPSLVRQDSRRGWFTPDRARVAAAAGGPADGPLSAPRVAFRSRPSAARDEPLFFAVDAAVAAVRAGAAGVAIRAGG